jgi:undecaprenyl-diphosphatase
MNIIDSTILTYVNQLSQHSLVLDRSIELIANNHLLKGGVIVTIIWWLWFKNDEFQSDNRERIIATLVGSIAGIALARFLALTLPFRLRPIHEKGLTFILPYGVSPNTLDGWSSFPSDHAVLFFALSTGLLFVSKKLGTLALFYSALFIAFPRMYLGLHYPTDIIAGAFIGIIIALLSNIYLIKNIRLKSIAHWSYSNPSPFYALFFLFSYQIADMFDSSRAVIKVGVELIKIVFA